MNYYNDNNPHAAQWLRNLIAAGLIPNGDVDDRSIQDIRAADLRGYTQCHFFAGIGAWPLALSLAGWPVDRPVWTASCPCQPFSIAGKGKGEADERHLWPVVAGLVSECAPAILFGEQVASADGRTWLSRVRLDLERMAYGVGAADLCAASIGAPHIRQRLYFGAMRLGDADDNGCEARDRSAYSDGGPRGFGVADAHKFGEREPKHAIRAEPRGNTGANAGGTGGGSSWGDAEWLACKGGKSRRVKSGVPLLVDGLPRNVAGALAGFGNAIVPPLAAQFIRAFDDATGAAS